MRNKAFERGVMHCQQDQVEGCLPLACVLRGEAPSYIPDEQVEKFVEGYLSIVEKCYGPQWATFAKDEEE